MQNFTQTWHNKKFLFCLFLFSLMLRALVFHLNKQEQVKLVFDALQYHDIATNILTGNGIALSTIKEVPQGNGTLVTMHQGLPIVTEHQYDAAHFTRIVEPNFFRLPGYPFFLATTYYFFGINIELALWIQVLLASLIPLLIFFLSLTLLPGNIFAARLAGIIASLHVGLVLYASLPLTETIFLIVFLLFCMMFFNNTQTPLTIFTAGTCLGMLSLIRAVGHYLLIISIFLLLCSQVSNIQKIKNVTIFTLGWLSIVSFWLIRNFILTGHLFFHTLPGLHFLQYSAVAVDMEVSKQDYFSTRTKWLNIWNDAVIKENKHLNQYETCKIAEDIAVDYLKQHPIIAIKLAIKEVLRTCLQPNSSLILNLPAGTAYNSSTSIWQKAKPFLCGNVTHPLLAPLVYLEIFLTLFIISGLLLSLWFWRTFLSLLLMLSPFIITLLGITLAYGCARLRLPVEPFLIIISSAGWILCLKK